MKKAGEKIIFIFMIIQAFAVGSIYMYCKREKWNLEEAMTVFLYPFFYIILIVFIILSLFLFIGYFISKLNHWKKIFYCIPIIITVTFIVVANAIYSEMKLREYNFKDYQEEREKIVELILAGTLVPDETGTVYLPEELQNEEMARGGCVYIVKYKEGSGIFFCTFSGVLESSAGYVFLTDWACDFSLNNTLVIQKQYATDWYYCGTD